jgi:hypothetical protein
VPPWDKSTWGIAVLVSTSCSQLHVALMPLLWLVIKTHVAWHADSRNYPASALSQHNSRNSPVVRCWECCHCHTADCWCTICCLPASACSRAGTPQCCVCCLLCCGRACCCRCCG